MKVPEGTICARCCYFFTNDQINKEKSKCIKAEACLWGAQDFIIGGVTYDVPMVTECTHFKLRCKEPGFQLSSSY